LESGQPSSSPLSSPRLQLLQFLRLDFLMKPPCQGILTSPEPCRLFFDHQEYPLRDVTAFQYVSMFYMVTHMPWNSEAYTLHPMVKAKRLEALGVDPRDIKFDLFANHKNHTSEWYYRKETSAFLFHWSKLESLLWKKHLDTDSQGHFQVLFKPMQVGLGTPQVGRLMLVPTAKESCIADS